jgi:hypothetical protein
MTNYEKIKSMSIEEMAYFIDKLNYINGICEHCEYQYKDCSTISCISALEQWLKSEVEE